MAGPVVVLAEVVERTVGLWCPQCRCLTGAALTMAYHLRGGGLALCTIARCTECRGPVREPTQ